MIESVIDPKVISDIKSNHALKQRLCEVNRVDMAAVDAMLRPSKTNGRPHAQKLTQFKNLVEIMCAYGYASFDDFLIEIDIPM
jgi:hypothetical protein